MNPFLIIDMLYKQSGLNACTKWHMLNAYVTSRYTTGVPRHVSKSPPIQTSPVGWVSPAMYVIFGCIKQLA